MAKKEKSVLMNKLDPICVSVVGVICVSRCRSVFVSVSVLDLILVKEKRIGKIRVINRFKIERDKRLFFDSLGCPPTVMRFFLKIHGQKWGQA